MNLRVSKEDFVKKYIGDLKDKYDENSIVIKVLREDAEQLYDQVTKLGLILVDEAELRQKLSDQEYIFRSKVSEGCKWFAFGQISLLKDILGES